MSLLPISVMSIYLDVKITGAARMPAKKAGDAIDAFIAAWTRERTDLDFEYLATLGRILRISAHLRYNMDDWLSPGGRGGGGGGRGAARRRGGGRGGRRP